MFTEIGGQSLIMCNTLKLECKGRPFRESATSSVDKIVFNHLVKHYVTATLNPFAFV